MIETTLNYLAPMSERPYYYTYPPPEGAPWRNTHGDRRRIRVHDARDLDSPPSLDREGFELVTLDSAVDPYDPEAVRTRYFAEVESAVAERTGATRVLAFDHNVRSAEKAERRENLAQMPVRFVHNDYTLGSGPQRLRDLIGSQEAEALLRKRFAVINVWKPIVGPVESAPLGFCDASSMQQSDFIATDLRYRDRVGEIYSLVFREEHRWFHYSAMRADEALLLKCFDSDPARARFTAHSAFDDPGSPEDAKTRESIEVRTLAFFDATSPQA